MLKLSRKEAERLTRTLDWVLAATLDTTESRQELMSIRDKVSNILKCSPNELGFKISVSPNETR